MRVEIFFGSNKMAGGLSSVGKNKPPGPAERAGGRIEVKQQLNREVALCFTVHHKHTVSSRLNVKKTF